MDNKRGFANPDIVVSSEWLADHLNDPDVRLIESNEDPLVYHAGHIPGAVEIDWTRDLNQPLMRDFIDSADMQKLLRRHGIREDQTLVFYGDKNNWWASYAFYIFSMFGLRNLKILDGGRLKWMREGKPMTRDFPEFSNGNISISERNDQQFRANRGLMMEYIAAENTILDVRSRQEYVGEALHMPGYLSDGALRAGRIPGSTHIHWEDCVQGEFSEYRSADELLSMYASHGITSETQLILYCRIGKRSSHNWLVLTQLLGFSNVLNYDAGWLEWGNLMGVPVER